MTGTERGVRAAAIAVALAATLAAAVACQGGAGGGGSPTGKPTVPTAASTLAELFPRSRGGSGGGRGSVRIPTAQVGDPAGGTVEIVNENDEPMTVHHVAASSDSGQMSVAEDNCSGVTLPPGGSCGIKVEHLAEQPGRFTGELAVDTSLGDTFHASVTGEAVGAVPAPSTNGSVTPETTTPEPTTPEPTTSEPTTPVPDTTGPPTVTAQPSYTPPAT